MDLDEDDALALVGEMRKRIGLEIRRVGEREGKDAVRKLMGLTSDERITEKVDERRAEVRIREKL